MYCTYMYMLHIYIYIYIYVIHIRPGLCSRPKGLPNAKTSWPTCRVLACGIAAELK